MKQLLLLAVAVVGLSLFAICTRTAAAAPGDMQGEHSMTGVLIDNMCGAKQATEADAAKHKASCSKKDSCAATGYQLIVGDKHYKFDDKGNDQAKAYFEKADSTHVVVMGKMEGDDKIAVSSIKPAEEKKG
jgi:hypothetical protein